MTRGNSSAFQAGCRKASAYTENSSSKYVSMVTRSKEDESKEANDGAMEEDFSNRMRWNSG